MLGSSMLKGTEDPTEIGTRKEHVWTPRETGGRKEHGWTLREMGHREVKEFLRLA